MSDLSRAAAKLIFDAADYQTAERIFNEMKQAIAGQERASVLVAIAFLTAAVSEDSNREFREANISAVADLARIARLPRKRRADAGKRDRQ